MCLRHADAPRCALFAAFEPLFRPLDEAPRRSRFRPFGSSRHTSSRSAPASFTYAPALAIARKAILADQVHLRGISGTGVPMAEIEVGGRINTSNPFLTGVT